MSSFGVSLAFDDGWKSAVTQAAPLLRQFDFPATFYVISNRLSEDFPEYVHPQDLHRLVAEGHEIGVHTRSHQQLPLLTPLDIRHEIQQGLTDLQAFGFTPKTFAYPYGEYNEQVLQEVARAGFIAARSILPGLNTPDTPPLLLRAHAVVLNGTSESVIEQIQQAATSNAWLIVYFHQIESQRILDESGWIYGSTPKVLSEILEYLYKHRIPVVSVETGARQLYQ
jgi:peptidoglycan/xylan/chitin deacetylase (PgdA/CDA1 family)